MLGSHQEQLIWWTFRTVTDQTENAKQQQHHHHLVIIISSSSPTLIWLVVSDRCYFLKHIFPSRHVGVRWATQLTSSYVQRVWHHGPVMCVGFGATLGPPSGPCALKDCQQLDQQMQAAQQDLLRGQGLNEQQAAEIKSQATLCDSLRGGRRKDPTNFNMNWDMLLFCSGGNMGLRIGCPNSFDGIWWSEVDHYSPTIFTNMLHIFGLCPIFRPELTLAPRGMYPKLGDN